MADNSTRTPGSGEDIASDEVVFQGNTVKFVRGKSGPGKSGSYLGDQSGQSLYSPLGSGSSTDEFALAVATHSLPGVRNMSYGSGVAYAAGDNVGNEKSVWAGFAGLYDALAQRIVHLTITDFDNLDPVLDIYVAPQTLGQVDATPFDPTISLMNGCYKISVVGADYETLPGGGTPYSFWSSGPLSLPGWQSCDLYVQPVARGAGFTQVNANGIVVSATYEMI